MRRLVLLYALTGCGRIAFDPLGATGDGGGALRDGRAATVNNYVFVSSEILTSAQIVSAANADQTCNRLAQGADLPGTYVAWISDPTSDAVTRLQSSRGWVRLDGRPVADAPSDITSGHILHPIMLDEVGIAHQDAVLTGTNAQGVRFDDCNGWTATDSVTSLLYGTTYTTSLLWTDSAEGTCDASGRIYCFGVDRAVPLSYTWAIGRRAFVTETSSQLMTGLADADARCNAAGVGGNFRALLATTTTTAASRFDPNGAPWVRLDGVALTDTAAELLAGPNLVAPLNLTPSGFYRPGSGARTGAATPNTLGINTCTDWTDPTNVVFQEMGIASSTTQWFYDAQLVPCAFPMPIYCLEQ